ncbi:alanine racemase [Stappia stellulata]|uniref:alanine racemase n=1 Tax=Stappia stellulata TaxID=71235 RepID=UPI000423B6DD|nr:alanine racemase [Stappia stellulata]
MNTCVEGSGRWADPASGAAARIEIRPDVLRQNFTVLRGLCAEHDIAISGVTKGVGGHPDVARLMLDAGIHSLADARLENIRRMRIAGITAPIHLLRPPGLGEIADAVRLTDLIFVSNRTTIDAIAHHARASGSTMKIAPMVDLGDLREGVSPGDLLELIDHAHALEGVEITGLGTNFACHTGLLPTRENLAVFAGLTEQVENRIGRALETVSGGNSASLLAMRRGDFPPKITHLRLGESLLFGIEVAQGTAIPGTRRDGFIIAAEILETWDRDTDPSAPRTRNALGEEVTLTVSGRRHMAVLGIGAVDTTIRDLAPVDPDVTLLGFSSDHTVIDISNARAFRPGDVLRFVPSYSALATAMSSPYLYSVEFGGGRGSHGTAPRIEALSNGDGKRFDPA